MIQGVAELSLWIWTSTKTSESIENQCSCSCVERPSWLHDGLWSRDSSVPPPFCEILLHPLWITAQNINRAFPYVFFLSSVKSLKSMLCPSSLTLPTELPLSFLHYSNFSVIVSALLTFAIDMFKFIHMMISMLPPKWCQGF